ncbi:7124_t:CDS:2 [Cetraspora pellucida]|uniref:7124_t:CDS:1 n=1 Tax=Cetraspora pellucida TaxID=1433469 RepID=A0ACA9MHE5_9GLOM|nr:7124_t:CDS:2 [Cetraspora pellucida]
MLYADLRCQIHIQLEHKQCAKIKAGFEELRGLLLITYTKCKMSKAKLLQKAVSHLKNQSRKKSFLLDEINHLTQTCVYLSKELEKNSNSNKSNQLKEFFTILKEAVKNCQYINYRMYVERYVKGKGWIELLNKLQFQDGTNEVVKIFSQMVDKIKFKSNDLLLLGILDIKYIEVHHKVLKSAYTTAGIWNELTENIQIQNLPNNLKKFIEEYILNQETEILKKINLKDKLLFRAT